MGTGAHGSQRKLTNLPELESQMVVNNHPLSKCSKPLSYLSSPPTPILFVVVLLGIEPRVIYMFAKHSTNEALFSLALFSYFEICHLLRLAWRTLCSSG